MPKKRTVQTITTEIEKLQARIKLLCEERTQLRVEALCTAVEGLCGECPTLTDHSSYNGYDWAYSASILGTSKGSMFTSGYGHSPEAALRELLRRLS